MAYINSSQWSAPVGLERPHVCHLLYHCATDETDEHVK